MCISFPVVPKLLLTIFQVVAEAEALATKVEGDSVSTQTADPGGHQMVLVGMALRVVDTGVATMEAAAAAAEGSVHREVVVGMEVGTVPILNGRAQGWTRIVIQNDQGIEHIFSRVPAGSHHGVSLPEYFSYPLSLSLVALLSLPPTCCVSIQCCLGCSTNGQFFPRQRIRPRTRT